MHARFIFKGVNIECSYFRKPEDICASVSPADFMRFGRAFRAPVTSLTGADFPDTRHRKRPHLARVIYRFISHDESFFGKSRHAAMHPKEERSPVKRGTSYHLKDGGVSSRVRPTAPTGGATLAVAAVHPTWVTPPRARASTRLELAAHPSLLGLSSPRPRLLMLLQAH